MKMNSPGQWQRFSAADAIRINGCLHHHGVRRHGDTRQSEHSEFVTGFADLLVFSGTAEPNHIRFGFWCLGEIWKIQPQLH